MPEDLEPALLQWVEEEMAQFRKHVAEAANASGDKRLAVLLTHIYTEHLLERYLLTKLPKGEKLVRSESFMYQKKLEFSAGFGDL